MNITHKMPILLSTLVLVMGLLYACPDADDSSEDSTSPLPRLKAEDITYDKDSIAQGTAGTATPSSTTITDFSTLKFALSSISTHTGTQTPPTIAEEGGIITVATDTSAGSYRVTITPDGSTFSGPLTVDFYVTIKANDVTDLDTKFQQAITDYGLTGDFNYIDISAVTDLYGFFAPGFNAGGVSDVTNPDRTYITNFNGDISKWDVSSVTDFRLVFRGATAFNQDISKWDVSAGTDFNNMFLGATAFNQDISKWDVSAGESFNNMFNGAAAFNQDLSGWTVKSTATMTGMFTNSGMTNLPSWYQP